MSLMTVCLLSRSARPRDSPPDPVRWQRFVRPHDLCRQAALRKVLRVERHNEIGRAQVGAGPEWRIAGIRFCRNGTRRLDKLGLAPQEIDDTADDGPAHAQPSKHFGVLVENIGRDQPRESVVLDSIVEKLGARRDWNRRILEAGHASHKDRGVDHAPTLAVTRLLRQRSVPT